MDQETKTNEYSIEDVKAFMEEDPNIHEMLERYRQNAAKSKKEAMKVTELPTWEGRAYTLLDKDGHTTCWFVDAIDNSTKRITLRKYLIATNMSVRSDLLVKGHQYWAFFDDVNVYREYCKKYFKKVFAEPPVMEEQTWEYIDGEWKLVTEITPDDITIDEDGNMTCKLEGVTLTAAQKKKLAEGKNVVIKSHLDKIIYHDTIQFVAKWD